MRIGNQDNAFTAIATSDEHTITVRGHDLVGDLIGQIDFTDYFWLLVCGQRPTEVQKAMMNACLVAIAEHGLVPSVQAARMTLAAAPEAWQGAMAAGLLGLGTVVAGSTEVAGRFLAEVVADGLAERHPAFVPTADDVTGAQGEGEGVVAVLAGVELGTLDAVLVEPAGVVHGHVGASLGFSAAADGDVFVLQTGGGGDDSHGVSFLRWFE